MKARDSISNESLSAKAAPVQLKKDFKNDTNYLKKRQNLNDQESLNENYDHFESARDLTDRNVC